MRVSLRKAAALQSAIAVLVDSAQLASEITLNEFQKPDEVRKGTEKFTANLARKNKLINAKYALRLLIGQANASVGIDEKLTEAARIDALINTYNPLVGSKTVEDKDVVTQRLGKLKDSSNNSAYRYTDSFTTSVVPTDFPDSAKSQVAGLKKAKQKIQDQVLELNIRTEISLDDDIVDVLKAEDLV